MQHLGMASMQQKSRERHGEGTSRLAASSTNVRDLTVPLGHARASLQVKVILFVWLIVHRVFLSAQAIQVVQSADPWTLYLYRITDEFFESPKMRHLVSTVLNGDFSALPSLSPGGTS